MLSEVKHPAREADPVSAHRESGSEKFVMLLMLREIRYMMAEAKLGVRAEQR